MRPVLKIPSRRVHNNMSSEQLRYLLLEAMGAYCVYCEAPLTVDIPYAHKISVSQTPHEFQVGAYTITNQVGLNYYRFNTAWVNQQLMCAACVTAKGESPNLEDALKFLQAYDQVNNSGLFNTIAGKLSNRSRLSNDDWDTLFQVALQTWVSPDYSADEVGNLLYGAQGDPTYSFITYVHDSRTQQALHDAGLLRLDLTNGVQNWMTQAQTKVWVVPNETAIDAWQSQHGNDILDMKTRVKNTIRGLNLNYSNPTDTLRFDRRVDNRTEVFTMVEQAWNRLNNLVTALAGKRGFDQDSILFTPAISQITASIRQSLRATGHWSLWARAFQRNVLDSPSGNIWPRIDKDLRRLFLFNLLIEYEVDPGQMASQIQDFAGVRFTRGSLEVRPVIPGLDIDRVPFAI
ncbi:MAG TPA: hypothetical protein P5526_01100 [Anaerolineae bacterium]|nr:hypothetical protein [Anaerolineae bacterium]